MPGADSLLGSPPLSPVPATPREDSEMPLSDHPLLHSLVPVFKVETEYDFDNPKNKSVADRYKATDSDLQFEYTQKQRSFAALATPTTSLQDIADKVWTILLVFLQLEHS
jgi:hypothetical protein